MAAICSLLMKARIIYQGISNAVITVHIETIMFSMQAVLTSVLRHYQPCLHRHYPGMHPIPCCLQREKVFLRMRIRSAEPEIGLRHSSRYWPLQVLLFIRGGANLAVEERSRDAGRLGARRAPHGDVGRRAAPAAAGGGGAAPPPPAP